MLADLKYALRQFRKHPGFTLAVVLILGLGIGANTAIFNAVEAVLLSPLPVKDARQLVFLTDPNAHGSGYGGHVGNRDLLSYPEFQDLGKRNTVFSGILAASSDTGVTEIGAVHPGQADARARGIFSLVSGSYFSVLGVNPVLGRTFSADWDQVPGRHAVAVISYRYWQERFAGDPAVLSRQLRLQGTLYDIIGVAPAGFTGETVGRYPALWIPLSMQPAVMGVDWLSPNANPLSERRCLLAIGRLQPGISLAQAQARLTVTYRQHLDARVAGVPPGRRPDFFEQRIGLLDASQGASMLRQGYGQPLVILLALVGLLLLLASANVANLLLTRATVRQKEIAVRVAMGAKPARIFRQMLTESLLLAALGGAAGIVLAQWGDALLLHLAGQTLDLRMHAGVLAFCGGVSLVVGLLFGAAPAWQGMRVDLTTALKGVVGGAPLRRFSVSRILLVTQVALSLLLLMVAGFFVHSFQKLAASDLGYEKDHLLVFGVDGAGAGYKPAALPQLYQTLIDRLRRLPEISGVSVSEDGLFSGTESDDPIAIDGYQPAPREEMIVNFDQVGPGYFTTVGIPLLRGREIERADAGAGERVGVINQTLARAYFGAADPIGRRVTVQYSTGPYDFVVVGVAADAKANSAREKTPRRFYVPYFKPMGLVPWAFFEVRTSGNAGAAAAAIRAAVREVAPKLPGVNPNPLSTLVGQTLGTDQLLTRLAGFFGMAAAVLVSIGVYGITSYAVARRTREFGIRKALGAPNGHVLRIVLGETLVLVAAGVAIGGPAAVGAERLISSLLFGLSPADPPVLAIGVGLMFAVAALAGYLPARRASRLDALVALRTE